MRDACAGAGHCFLDQHVHAAFPVGDYAQQHRQIDARHAFDPAGFEELGRGVGGGGAEDVGEDQHAVAGVGDFEQATGEGECVEGIILPGHAQLHQLQRATVHHVAGALDERFAKGAVGYEEDADHSFNSIRRGPAGKSE